MQTARASGGCVFSAHSLPRPFLHIGKVSTRGSFQGLPTYIKRDIQPEQALPETQVGQTATALVLALPS